MSRKKPDAVRDVRVREVIEVVFLRGEGVEDDPVRQVTAYYDPDGTRLAERDPMVWLSADGKATS